MRRVLVPLDGSEFATAILPDARRLAGPDGELLLIRDAGVITYDKTTGKYTYEISNEAADRYLESVAAALREDGVRVRAERLIGYDVALAIDSAAETFDVDMIACATHGLSPAKRLVRGSVAWKALAHSPVPVLLRHIPEHWEKGLSTPEPSRRRILVPLDGSTFAEQALVLAGELAKTWQASIWLVQAIPDMAMPASTYGRWTAFAPDFDTERQEAEAYLNRIVERVAVEVHTDVIVGPPVAQALIHVVREQEITDVVMASHGRTGLSRVVLGSVTDELIHALTCPILVVPAHAHVKVQPETSVEASHSVSARL